MEKKKLEELAAQYAPNDVVARFEHLLYGMSEAEAIATTENNEFGAASLLKKPLHENPAKSDDILLELAGKGYMGDKAKELAIQVAAKQIIPYARTVARNMDSSLSKAPSAMEEYDMIVFNRATELLPKYDSEHNSFPAFVTRQIKGDFYEMVNKSKGAVSNTKYAASVRRNVAHAIEEMEQKRLDISEKSIARYINLIFKPSRPYSEKTVRYGLDLMSATTADVDPETANQNELYESPEEAIIRAEEREEIVNALSGPEINKYIKIIYNLYLDLAYNGELTGPLTSIRIAEEIEAKTGKVFSADECKELHERMKKTLKDKLSPGNLGSKKPVSSNISGFAPTENDDLSLDIVFE